jgi:hypothetical protein
VYGLKLRAERPPGDRCLVSGRGRGFCLLTASTLLKSTFWLLFLQIKWPERENDNLPTPSFLHTLSRRGILINPSILASIHCTEHELPASVYSTVGNAFKGIINLKPLLSEH